MQLTKRTWQSFNASILVLLGWDVPTSSLILAINTSFLRRINAPWPHKAELQYKFSGTQKEAKRKKQTYFQILILKTKEENYQTDVPKAAYSLRTFATTAVSVARQ
jgi:hypothetical protein